MFKWPGMLSFICQPNLVQLPITIGKISVVFPVMSPTTILSFEIWRITYFMCLLHVYVYVYTFYYLILGRIVCIAYMRPVATDVWRCLLYTSDAADE